MIPTWNRSALLRRALTSVRGQTWPHWEALIVDDGSDDDTREVVASLAEADPRIRLIARPHEGVGAARNAGLAEARGGFVAFLDSDNEWMPRFLEVMVGVMTARSLDAAYGSLMVMTKDGPRYRSNPVTRDILRVANHVDMNVLMVRSALLQRIGGFDTSLPRTVDYDLVLRIADETDLVYVPLVGVLYDRSAPDRISARVPVGVVGPRAATAPPGLGPVAATGAGPGPGERGGAVLRPAGGAARATAYGDRGVHGSALGGGRRRRDDGSPGRRAARRGRGDRRRSSTCGCRGGFRSLSPPTRGSSGRPARPCSSSAAVTCRRWTRCGSSPTMPGNAPRRSSPSPSP